LNDNLISSKDIWGRSLAIAYTHCQWQIKMHKINKKTIIIFTLPFVLISCLNIASKGVNYFDTRQSHQILCIGDSIMHGNGDTNDGTRPCSVAATDMSLTYANTSIGGTCTGYNDIFGDSALNQLIVYFGSNTTSKVYSEPGVNDIGYSGCNTKLSAWLTYYQSILTNTVNAGATLYPMQILPTRNHPVGGDISQIIKIWNAWLEDWAYTNSLNLVPSYIEMGSPTTDDAINVSYNTPDGIHPNYAGDSVLGYLMSKSAVPTRSRDWGNASYPDFGHESWSWWLITGTGSLNGGTTDSTTGHLNGGSLYLSQSASAVSDVLAILPNSHPISITHTTTQGTPVISYLTSTSNFARSAETSSSTIPSNNGSWTIYTMPFTLTPGTAQFIQIKISNSNATELHVDTLTLNWNTSSSAYTTNQAFWCNCQDIRSNL